MGSIAARILALTIPWYPFIVGLVCMQLPMQDRHVVEIDRWPFQTDEACTGAFFQRQDGRACELQCPGHVLLRRFEEKLDLASERFLIDLGQAPTLLIICRLINVP
jgi:hypothetical protein